MGSVGEWWFVCVCMERERETDRQTDRHRDADRDTTQTVSLEKRNSFPQNLFRYTMPRTGQTLQTRVVRTLGVLSLLSEPEHNPKHSTWLVWNMEIPVKGVFITINFSLYVRTFPNSHCPQVAVKGSRALLFPYYSTGYPLPFHLLAHRLAVRSFWYLRVPKSEESTRNSVLLING